MTPANKRVQELMQRFAKIRNNPYVFAMQQALPDEIYEFADWQPDDLWALEDLAADELYQKAQKWARRLHQVASERHEAGVKDPDLRRVLGNVFLVPAKILYACSETETEMDEEFEEIENEVSLHGYTLCLGFLQQVQRSLTRLIAKGLSPTGEWRASLLAADKLVLEIQGRMIDLARKLRED